ncbi:dephospho-CoA kinase [Arenibacter sp. GZD96]|uniref:dephospho-CoA kinase n=1 Tax=Aurantibrevibacter litoralis TaxID=3106030 RepID=UPI002AFEFC67|nr:dephospho-CoA kinase [Arenibacter sp. GZD-96]MEA1786353.1 dephospho-CoA kinase [Arenibacter sp. GZD-96]
MIVGLTGGIGSGKSTVAQMFSELGIAVYYADKEAKNLMHSSLELRKSIISLLGSEAYQDEELNSPWVAQKIFHNKTLLQQMNALVHPMVKAHFLEWVKNQNTPYVIQENALIFEQNAQANFDKIILVVAPVEERIRRVQKRDNTTKDSVMARIANQLEDTEKQELTHYVIQNRTLKNTKAQVLKIHKELLELRLQKD